VEEDRPLPRDHADGIALAVQRWAIQLGATHYAHWFHPLTGAPAEKHDSFVGIQQTPGHDARPVEDFDGGKLLQGEPDGSSFPSGGLRETSAARGYTTWDPTSPLFVTDDAGVRTLCVPCAFTSWRGHALDHKVPLLRARAAVERATLRLLRLTGDTSVQRVVVTLGPEQEYFLIDRGFLADRPDILMSGRSLLGAAPERGQQLEDHYFAGIPARVSAFIADVETELWALGVPVKTRHNEVAPAQFETAPVFEEVNVACDHNALTMDVLRRVAARHGLVCLLHEKPFAGVNGSGKHNNWALSTDTGVNLLDPGEDPVRDIRFLLVLGSTLLAVKQHAAVLRATVASAGNDHRLGANEAPPSILSAYLGAALDAAVEAVVRGEERPAVASGKQQTRIAESIYLRRDPGDRNRTSPFAFTGNKFEFRAVGSSENCGWPQAVLNAAVADAMHVVCDRIEARLATGIPADAAVHGVAREVLTETRVVCFEGNGYGEEWRDEASRRGLPNLRDSAAALAVLHDRKATEFLVRHGVFTEEEVESRAEIVAERYLKQLDIEARTLADVVRTFVLPAVEQQVTRTASAARSIAESGGPDSALRQRLTALARAADALVSGTDDLQTLVDHIATLRGSAAMQAVSQKLVPAMASLRHDADAVEALVADSLWPLPRYREMLFLGV
jgi:glutamine synthetase